MRETFLIIHFIGLTMAVGTGFANLFLGVAASKLNPEERGSFMSKISILMRMGHIGLGLLLLSGFYLATPFWKSLSDMPLFITKLIFVGVLIILISVISIRAAKAKKANDPAQLAKLKPLGMLIFLTGITTLIIAVLTFR
ncbi:MAG: hypothetical protein JST48_00190 [Bacteroidetes bacterium]|nr:hypothetical protein [Bacteroidota bacterium]